MLRSSSVPRAASTASNHGIQLRAVADDNRQNISCSFENPEGPGFGPTLVLEP